MSSLLSLFVCRAAQVTCCSILYTFQVEKLRICLEEARRRLGAQSRSLQQQWRRGITLGDTARLLGDVNSISDAPQRVQKLEEAKVRHCYTMFEALQLAHSVQFFVQQRANWQAGTCSCLVCLPTLGHVSSLRIGCERRTGRQPWTCCWRLVTNLRAGNWTMYVCLLIAQA